MKKILFVLALLAVSSAWGEPVITEYDTAKVLTNGNVLTVQLFLKNTGSAMTQDWIVEIQPRPKGTLPLSVTGQDVCDPTTPANVHRGFRLAAGEQGVMTLTTSLPPGTYDVYILGRDKCYNTLPVGSTVVGPWGYYHLMAADVKILGGAGLNIDLTTAAGVLIIVVAFFLLIGGKRK